MSSKIINLKFGLNCLVDAKNIDSPKLFNCDSLKNLKAGLIDSPPNIISSSTALFLSKSNIIFGFPILSLSLSRMLK